MENHFGKGLMAGLQASMLTPPRMRRIFAPTINAGLCSATRTACLKKPATASSAPGKRGSSLVAMAWKRHGDGLFQEGGSSTAMRYFMAGYRLES